MKKKKSSCPRKKFEQIVFDQNFLIKEIAYIKGKQKAINKQQVREKALFNFLNANLIKEEKKIQF